MFAKEHNMNEDTKYQNQMCQNEAKPIIPIPVKVLADVVGCSESTVKKVRTNKRSADSELGKKITKAEDLLNTCIEVAIDKVKITLRVITLLMLLTATASCKKECVEPLKKRVTPAPDKIIGRPVLEPKTNW